MHWILLLALWSDEVRMKNGDRISGQLLRLDEKELVLKSEYAGDLKIKRDAIDTIETTTPVHVTLKNGQTLAQPVKLAATEVELLFRDKADETSHRKQTERARNPRLVDFWTGTFDLGYAQSRGNASTNTISSSAKLTRVTPRNSINANFFSLYSKNKNGNQYVPAANAIRGGLKFDTNLSPRYYTFASTDFEFDQFQNLDLRFVPAGGFGLHFLKNKATIWDLSGGASLNREYFNTGLDRSSVEVLAGNDLAHKFGGIFTLTEKTVFYNNVSESETYRLNSDLAFAAAIRRWVSWQVSASDRYLSNPLPGRKTNDILVTTGVRLVFLK